MKARDVAMLVFVALVPLSGCPFAPPIMLGVWLFSLDGSAQLIGAEFLENGEMEEFELMNEPPGADLLFGGEVTWQQNGKEITLLQDTANTDRLFSGTVESSTRISGTWMNIAGTIASGTFTAEKAPTN